MFFLFNKLNKIIIREKVFSAMSIQIMMTLHVYCLWAVPVKVQIPVCLAYWLTVCKQLPSGSPVHPSAPAASDHRPCCLWSDPSQSASRSLCIQLASPALFGKPRYQIQQILNQTLKILHQMIFRILCFFLLHLLWGCAVPCVYPSDYAPCLCLH